MSQVYEITTGVGQAMCDRAKDGGIWGLGRGGQHLEELCSAMLAA